MKAPLTVNGYMIQFDRRRYGSTTYTWAYAVVDDQLVSLGDPYPAIRFPIRRKRHVDANGADDRRSQAADNTSAFNCRFVAGTSRWSEHAYGHAIDVNPIENPYVTADGHVSPPAGAPYADRSQQAKGLIHRKGPVVAAFRENGWEWGGNWPWPKDYQHFSAGGN